MYTKNTLCFYLFAVAVEEGRVGCLTFWQFFISEVWRGRIKKIMFVSQVEGSLGQFTFFNKYTMGISLESYGQKTPKKVLNAKTQIFQTFAFLPITF